MTVVYIHQRCGLSSRLIAIYMSINSVMTVVHILQICEHGVYMHILCGLLPTPPPLPIKVYSQHFDPNPQCRERGVSYKGKVTVKLMYQVDGEEVREETRVVGQMPIMVKSEKCNLRNKTPQQLIKLHEEVCVVSGARAPRSGASC